MKSISYFIILIIQFVLFTPTQAQNNEANSQILNIKHKSIVPIAAFAANGDLKSLERELNVGLNEGLTVNEIKEVLVHLYAYAGFPRSIRGLQTLISVLSDRQEKGINDEWGKEASLVSDSISKYERGKINLEKLTGISQDGAKKRYAKFSPEIEIFLKEHLFADLFDRDVLTYTDREITTVSVLITLGNLEPMMRSHMRICLKLGITAKQLDQLIIIIEKNIGKKEAATGKQILNEILKNN